MRKPRRLDETFLFPGFRPATPRRGSYGSVAGEKNGLWIVWAGTANVLRSQDPSSTRPLLWRHPGVPGDRDPARALPELRRREAGEAALVGQQPLLHQAVRLLRRPSLSGRDGTVRDVARELRLDWKTVKALEMEYMREQLRRVGTPDPKVIGIDELSVGRGHNYRIIVSDLIRGRPIWFGGTDRSEKSMDLFFQWLGPRKCKGIRLAVMDMWKPFRRPISRRSARYLSMRVRPNARCPKMPLRPLTRRLRTRSCRT
jgi:hypothetical protein